MKMDLDWKYVEKLFALSLTKSVERFIGNI